VFSLKEWIDSPQSMKVDKLRLLQKLANGETLAAPAPAEPAKAQPQAKVVADSVIPDLKKGGTSEPGEQSEEAMFKKRFERGVRM
jgi:hypothetical protein